MVAALEQLFCSLMLKNLCSCISLEPSTIGSPYYEPVLYCIVYTTYIVDHFKCHGYWYYFLVLMAMMDLCIFIYLLNVPSEIFHQ